MQLLHLEGTAVLKHRSLYTASLSISSGDDHLTNHASKPQTNKTLLNVKFRFRQVATNTPQGKLSKACPHMGLSPLASHPCGDPQPS